MTDTTITFSEVSAILEKLNARQREARELVADIYQSAVDVCATREAQIEEVSHTEFHASELADLVETAVLKPKPSRTALDVASGVFGQYMASLVAREDISPAETRNGHFIAASAIRFSADLNPAQRSKVLSSLVMAAGNHFDTGLVTFEGTEIRTLPAPVLMDWLAILDMDALTSWKDEKAQQSRDLLTIRGLIDSLEAARPALYQINLDKEPSYSVRNVQRSRQALEGVVLEPEAVTSLSAEEYHRLRLSKSFTAKVNAGHLVPQTNHAAVEGI